MKVRLLEKGFENLTGFFGAYEFEKGVSVKDLSLRAANQIAGAVRAETFENETPIGGAADVAGRDDGAPVVAALASGADAVEEVVEEVVEESDDAIVEDAVSMAYTFEELANIADKDGIAGLRKISESLKVKGRSVKDLIDGILKTGATPETVED